MKRQMDNVIYNSAVDSAGWENHAFREGMGVEWVEGKEEIRASQQNGTRIWKNCARQKVLKGY